LAGYLAPTYTHAGSPVPTIHRPNRFDALG
jgi:hypothetical protein